ncbi:thioredoxin-like protein [Amylostereum chailletii]|nr:thioredoxin-like protein [Amylostereum chailletii]
MAARLTRPLRTAFPSTRLTRSFSTSMRRYEQFLDANAETFEKVIAAASENDRVVLVDFKAEWCHPCKMLSPILESLTSDASVTTGNGESLDLVTIDTDTEVELAARYKIRSLPTVVAFRDGQPISQFIGALPEPSVRKFLETL